MPPQQPQTPYDPNQQPQALYDPNQPPVPPQPQNPYGGQPATQYTQSAPMQDSSPVLQIVGLVLAFLLPPIGLILSVIGIGKARRMNDHAGKIMSLIGIIIGSIGTLLLLGIAILTFIAGAQIKHQAQQVQSQSNSISAQTDLRSVQNSLEGYFANNGTTYPTLAQLNDANWRSQNNMTLDYTGTFVSGNPGNGQVSYVPSPSGCDASDAHPCTGYKISTSVNGQVQSLESLQSGD